jgi:hypothetical protein
MEMIDQPRWQSGPVEFRVAVCRALLVALADAWVQKAGGADGADHVESDQNRNDDRSEDYGLLAHAAAAVEVDGLPSAIASGVTPRDRVSKSTFTRAAFAASRR